MNERTQSLLQDRKILPFFKIIETMSRASEKKMKFLKFQLENDKLKNLFDIALEKKKTAFFDELIKSVQKEDKFSDPFANFKSKVSPEDDGQILAIEDGGQADPEEIEVIVPANAIEYKAEEPKPAAKQKSAPAKAVEKKNPGVTA